MKSMKTFIRIFSRPVLVTLVLGGAGAGELAGSTEPRAGTRPSKARKGRPGAAPRTDAPAQAAPGGPSADAKAETGPPSAPTLGQVHRTKAEKKAEALRLAFHAGENLAGRDLATLDLRGANLTGRDLRGWLLAGKDLTRAILAKANLTGVSLKGTRLFGADTRGAIGLDLTGALTLPFFVTSDRDPRGRFQYLLLDDPEGQEFKAAAPLSLAAGPGATLWLVPGGGRQVVSVSPLGTIYDHRPDQDLAFTGLTVDPMGRIWCALDGKLLLLSLNGERPESFTVEDLKGRRPLRMDPGGKDEVLVTLPDRVVRYQVVGKGKDRALDTGYIPHPKGCLEVQARFSRDGKVQVYAPATDHVLLVREYGSEFTAVLDLPKDTRCTDLAPGPGGNIWFCFTGAGGHGIGYVARTALGAALPFALELIRLPSPEDGREPRELRSLAPAPDGASLWFTDGGGRIGQVTPSGVGWAIEEFPLPEGESPERIVPLGRDRMCFTLRDKNRIGSIRAVDGKESREATAKPALGRSAGPSPAAGALTDERGFDISVYKPKPAPPRKEHKAQRPERDPEDRLDAAASPEAGPSAAPAAAPAAPAGPGPAAPAPRVPTAAEYLAALPVRVDLYPQQLTQIVAKHGINLNPAKSQFDQPFSTERAVEALIAKGLWESGTFGLIRSGNTSDLDGRRLTVCEQDGVGWYNRTRVAEDSDDKWVPTHLFTVVTEEYPDQSGHWVVSAYPERPWGI